MPAATQQIGVVCDENGNLCPVKNAMANIAASQTDSVIVAAVAGKRIRVIGYLVQCGGTATTLTFNSKGAGAGTAISFQHQNSANGGVCRVSADGSFAFQTGVGEGLTATTGTGSTTGVQVSYFEV